MPKSIFLNKQGNTPLNRVWNFMIIHQDWDYSMKEIAKLAKVGYTTIKRIWQGFKQQKLVIPTRSIGKAKMYKLNLKNPVVQRFIDFYWAVVEAEVDKQLNTKQENSFTSAGPVSLPASAHHF